MTIRIIYAWTGWMTTVRNWSPLRKKGLFSMIAVEVQNLTKTSTRSKHKLLFLPNCMDQAQTRKDKIGKMSRGAKETFRTNLEFHRILCMGFEHPWDPRVLDEVPVILKGFKKRNWPYNPIQKIEKVQIIKTNLKNIQRLKSVL